MKIFKTVILGLLPAALLSIVYFKEKAAILLVVGILSAVGSEAIFQFIFKRKYTFKDGGAIVTGLLLALSVSPSTPWYALAISAAVGIVFGKQVFGGFPKNIFNPALFGRLFMIFAFPNALKPWLTPFDLTSSATPLEMYATTNTTSSLWDLFIGNVAGSIGEVSALALLLGGGYLLYKKFANWRIPAGILGTVFVFAMLMGQNPLFHLLSGSVILGSIFMATDPATSPKTNDGRWVFAVLIGVIIMSIRLWGWAYEGTTFAILGMNYLVPLINEQMGRLKKK